MAMKLTAVFEKVPEGYIGFVEELPGANTVLTISQESLELLDNYQKRKILSRRFRNDMLHIAVATIAEADILVSWNFRHIVRFDKIRLFNAVNIELGYRELSIYSPREVASHETED